MKYYVSINDKQYEVEVEQGQAEVLSVSPVQETAVPVMAAPILAVPAPAAQAAPAPAPVAAGSGEAVTAPMPGNILSINVQQGQSVKSGDLLAVLEAMKMENEILAPRDGIVSQVVTQKGAVVDTGAPLLYLQ